jgi:hypothetical protein
MKTEWTDRYIYAVTKELPESQRSDIEKELRSLIEDMLDERTQGREAAQKDIEEVLLELGNPRELADRYRDHKRYLIGPEIYPTYFFILKIVLSAISIAMVVLFAVRTVTEPLQIVDHIVDTLATYVSACFQGFSWVTIMFALMDHFGVRNKDFAMEEAGEWKLSDLPDLPDERKQIRRADPIASIIFTLFFGILFIFSINLFGIWVFREGHPGGVVQFFSEPVFRSYLPYIWASLAFGVIVEIFKLVIGKWTLQLIGLEFLNHVVSLAVGLVIFGTGAIWNPNFMQQAVLYGLVPASGDAYASLQSVWTWITTSMVYLISMVFVLQMILTGIKVFRVRRGS